MTCAVLDHPAILTYRETWQQRLPEKVSVEGGELSKYSKPSEVQPWQRAKARAMSARGTFTHQAIADACEITYCQAREIRRSMGAPITNGRPRVSKLEGTKQDRVRAMLAAGTPVKTTARLLGVGRRQVQGIKEMMSQ